MPVDRPVELPLTSGAVVLFLPLSIAVLRTNGSKLLVSGKGGVAAPAYIGLRRRDNSSMLTR